MSESIDEQLSALADDELPRNDAPLLLRQLGKEPELVERLGRYYVIREAIRGGLADGVDGRFAAGVAAALEDEPALAAGSARPGGARRVRRARPVAGAAVAASVAVMAVALWPTNRSPEAPSTSSPQVVMNPPATTSTAGELARTVTTDERVARPDVQRLHWQRLDPRVQRRLNGYLVNHSENAMAAGTGGVLNYVRLAGHERAQ